MLNGYKIPVIITVLTLLAVFAITGLEAALTVAILGILEISLSFDNAVVNAKILGRMAAKWQRIFLTVGILIAVFGTRLLLPFLVVACAAGLNPLDTVQLALQHPHDYAQHLQNAHPAIASFGGLFLGMLFLDWLFEKRDTQWLKSPEKMLARIGKLHNASTIIMSAVLIITALTFNHPWPVFIAGALGLITYQIIHRIDRLFTRKKGLVSSGLVSFLYIEMIDASFSLDGVLGAFAITSNIFLIAIGLGIGAIYIRNLTVHLVQKDTLTNYIYLEHGAHWAIGALAALLLLTISFEIPQFVSAVISIGFIAAALAHSVYERPSRSSRRRART